MTHQTIEQLQTIIEHLEAIERQLIIIQSREETAMDNIATALEGSTPYYEAEWYVTHLQESTDQLETLLTTLKQTTEDTP